ncbi:hypothetical protein J5O04_03175 [Corynebacterium hindlerae]|uniref:hypothetical protein n=1 Tax=Corynebacterium hindlerae TaxID=699041 RepID=UPI001AD632B7|nr:hypothetical protein [Corynebacterium hindlerae]QTH60149.1 hypothetical protein J5O04_03175 [Corynebacterium hindlerae]
MNLLRFRDEMSQCLRPLEEENLYREAGETKKASLKLIGVWDDGLTIQLLLLATAGDFYGFAGYADQMDPHQRSRFRDPEKEIAHIMRRNGMWGDTVLTVLKRNVGTEIVWRYPQSGELHPETLEEVERQTRSIPRWLDPQVFGEYIAGVNR